MKVNVTGGWIDLREPEEVPERLRRPIVSTTMSGIPMQAEIEAMQDNPDQADPVVLAKFLEFSQKFGDLAALAFIREWSFAEPITSETIQDLPSKVFDEIQEAISPLTIKLLPTFGATKESVLDPKAPTDS